MQQLYQAMKNISIYIDIAFCILLLPLMIIVFPIERRWGIYLIFFCIFVVWLYITYFSYRYYIIPRLLRGGRERAYALGAIAVSLLITFIFSSYEIKSPFNLLREEQLFSNSFLHAIYNNNVRAYIIYRERNLFTAHEKVIRRASTSSFHTVERTSPTVERPFHSSERPSHSV